jgi:hypothetical protein
VSVPGEGCKALLLLMSKAPGFPRPHPQKVEHELIQNETGQERQVATSYQAPQDRSILTCRLEDRN